MDSASFMQSPQEFCNGLMLHILLSRTSLPYTFLANGPSLGSLVAPHQTKTRDRLERHHGHEPAAENRCCGAARPKLCIAHAMAVRLFKILTFTGFAATGDRQEADIDANMYGFSQNICDMIICPIHHHKDHAMPSAASETLQTQPAIPRLHSAGCSTFSFPAAAMLRVVILNN